MYRAIWIGIGGFVGAIFTLYMKVLHTDESILPGTVIFPRSL